MLTPPIYRGLSLGTERDMKFRNSMVRPGKGDPAEAYHAYIGDELSRTITDWERVERVVETDNIDGGILSYNASVNISELARCNIEELITYVFAYLHLHPDSAANVTGGAYRNLGPELHPSEVLVNTLIKSGHSQGLMRMMDTAFSFRVEDRSHRVRLFARLFIRRGKRLMRHIKYALPSDPVDVVWKLAKLKADEMDYNLGPVPFDEDDLVAGLDEVGMSVAPARGVCCKELRKRPMTVVNPTLYRLEHSIEGDWASEGQWKISNITTYGLTAAASQL
ncbi:hypothetical protein GWK47_012070 [Chionoecetes opilio]|uniref:Uncharacterized protein n=1 Tax=Chionoecetes opilio TaxID=41210 RepID=A0A8J4XW95_CHIOP|nr:hypothetical protein GWK47_012070 [Chionoecetes opilio]